MQQSQGDPSAGGGGGPVEGGGWVGGRGCGVRGLIVEGEGGGFWRVGWRRVARRGCGEGR